MEKNCKKCSSKVIIKSGFIRGHQRYRCKSCGYQFTDTERRGLTPSLKAFAVVLYAHCGMSMGNIAKMFRVSTVAVLKWVRKYESTITSQTRPNKADIIMIDEMWHFVNGKKPRAILPFSAI